MNAIILEKKEDTAIIYFNRPEALNSLSIDLLEQLDKALHDIEKDKKIKFVIFTGKGDKAFSAGADIKYLNGLDKSGAKKFVEFAQGLYNRIENLGKVTIAAVNGYCLGGGHEIAMSCDLIIASNTSKFGQPEVTIGIIPGAGGTQRLSRFVGLAKAKELVFTGKIIDADEALRLGLVNKVVGHRSLTDEVNKIITSIRKNSLDAVISAKHLLNKSVVEGKYLDERKEFIKLFETYNQKEGMKAFLEKRKANFK